MQTNHFFVERPGEFYGLGLVLRSDAGEYLPTNRNHAIRLSLHTPDEAQLPDFRGFTVSPGTAVDIKLRYEKFQRIDFPSGSCKNGQSSDNLYNPAAYEKEVCKNNFLFLLRILLCRKKVTKFCEKIFITQQHNIQNLTH